MTLLLAILAAALTQPPKPNQPEHVPPDVILEEIRSAYTLKPTADEVRVVAKEGVSRTDAADRFTIRIDPGSGPTPARMLFEMGGLSIYLEGAEVTAVNSGAPGLYYRATLPGPPTPLTLAKSLPPIPAPQIAFACRDPEAQRRLTPYTINVGWTDALVDSTARPPISVLSGNSDAGKVTLVVSANGRLSRFSGDIKSFGSGSSASALLELRINPMEPGDPAKWAISTEGRERVKNLADLKLVTQPAAFRPIGAGDQIPNFKLVRADHCEFEFHSLCGDAAPQGIALILFRANLPEPGWAAWRDARAGMDVINSIRQAEQRSEDAATQLLGLKVVPGIIMDWSHLDRHRLSETQSHWKSVYQSAPELYWITDDMASIDRFDSKAAAILALINPDKKLIKTIPLDGRASDPAALAADIRAALGARP